MHHQTFTLVNSSVSTLYRSTENDYTLREYMFTLFRRRALEELLETQPTAKQVMALVSNIGAMWTDFNGATMHMSDEDIDEMFEAFTVGLRPHDELFRCLTSRPQGDLYYQAVFN